MDDIADTLAPKSDQLDAIDLANRPPQIVTITKVDVKADPRSDQPVQIHLAEFDRPWRPGVNMRRVLGYCWDTKSSKWIGRQAEIYNDETVSFGKERTGGIRISRLSHIDGPKDAPILLSQGRPGRWHVDPLPDAPPALTEAMIACCVDIDQLREWHRQHPGQRADIEARVAEIKGAEVGEPS